MISRVAEHCTWMHRYVERAESIARLLSTTGSTMMEEPGLPRWNPVLIVAGEQPLFVERYGAGRVEDEVLVNEFLTWDGRCASSIYSSLAAARENARTLRDTISREVWETLNEAWLWIDSPAGRQAYEDDRAGFYGRVRDLGFQFRGAALGTMLADEPLRFMELGMYLERAGQTARMLDVKHHVLGPTSRREETSQDTITWIATLFACSAYEGYFKQHRGSVRGPRVARFLVLEPLFPRSVVHCVRAAVDVLDTLRDPARPLADYRSGALLLGMRAHLEGLDQDGLIAAGVHEELTAVIDGLGEVGAALYADFFDPVVVRMSDGDGASQVNVQ